MFGKQRIVILVSAVWYVLLEVCGSYPADYWRRRDEFLDQEKGMGLGSSIELTKKEVSVNEILMRVKREEFERGFTDPGSFLPARHFFQAKEDMEKSKTFLIIKQMPKGGALHLHDTGLVSTDYVMNLTYRSGLFMCTTDPSGLLRLHFFVTPDTSCEWEELSAVRRRSEDVAEFDHRLRENLTMVVDNPRGWSMVYSSIQASRTSSWLLTTQEAAQCLTQGLRQRGYPNINAAWQKFSGLFSVVNGMVTYRPLFEEYYYQTLQEFLDDGVAYVEMRGVLPDVRINLAFFNKLPHILVPTPFGLSAYNYANEIVSDENANILEEGLSALAFKGERENDIGKTTLRTLNLYSNHDLNVITSPVYCDMRCHSFVVGFQVYDLDGTVHSGLEVMRIYEEVTRRFQNNNPGFIGAKFIYAPSRRVDNETMDRYLNMTLTLKNTFGSFLAGFDLVGQEDRGRPLKDFAEKLLQFPEDVNLFFHAGETNWQGMTDENLIDTLMFNATKRIGHGYALLKHPLALREVKRRGIALEINPISNQVSLQAGL
ncbi:unnamed protein product [Timema podura]|uniref:Adenosine/AMP deaminase N-terminal domain-containing protein n=1 Tax=Timema podura TaxID=61482 RepID=A0ABN7NYM9_TIMPD|nr:unnamed protein product [Timema podura]